MAVPGASHVDLRAAEFAAAAAPTWVLEGANMAPPLLQATTRRRPSVGAPEGANMARKQEKAPFSRISPG